MILSLNMCIGSLLIEKMEVDFSGYETVKNRQDKIFSLCNEITDSNSSIFFDEKGNRNEIHPHFYLHAISGANKIITDDNYGQNILVNELEKELRIIQQSKKK